MTPKSTRRSRCSAVRASKAAACFSAALAVAPDTHRTQRATSGSSPGFESYAVTDNVSELTARINDDGWESSYEEWLRSSRLRETDCLFVFSVGGGSLERSVSVNLVRAMQLAQMVGASIVGIVGRDGGELRQRADACVVLPTVDEGLVTPQTEGLQALVWHLIVSHPALDPEAGKWESDRGRDTQQARRDRVTRPDSLA